MEDVDDDDVGEIGVRVFARNFKLPPKVLGLVRRPAPKTKKPGFPQRLGVERVSTMRPSRSSDLLSLSSVRSEDIPLALQM